MEKMTYAVAIDNMVAMVNGATLDEATRQATLDRMADLKARHTTSGGAKKPSKKQTENEVLASRLVGAMECDKVYTPDEITALAETLIEKPIEPITKNRVIAQVGKLVRANAIIRVDLEKRKVGYKVA